MDKAVPLIKVLIELNGCGNEQMSSIKSKESDRPINKSEHNYNTGYGPGSSIVNCYRGIYGNWPHNRQQPNLPRAGN